MVLAVVARGIAGNSCSTDTSQWDCNNEWWLRIAGNS